MVQAGELESLRNEKIQLLAALGRQTGEAWQPHLGEVVTIGEDWDGQARYSHSNCLTLLRSDQVRVDHLSDDGWLWGQVEPDGPSGWFGGRDCRAVRQIEVFVALGPQDGRSAPPRGMPGQPEEGGDESYLEGDGQEYLEGDADEGGELPPLDADAMEWIDRHGLDQSVQEALQELGAEDRRTVVGGELVNCRNPSAVALSRIKGMLRGAKNFVSGMPPASGGTNGRRPPIMPVPNARPTIPIIPRDAPTRFRSRSPRRGTRGAPIGGPTSTSLPTAPPRMQPGLRMEVEAYVQRHGIDEKAAQQLLDLPDHLARDVMQTDLFNVRNPSAVLMKRIRTVEQGGQPPVGPLGRQLGGQLAGQPPPPAFPPPNGGAPLGPPSFPPPPAGAPPSGRAAGQPPPPATPVPRRMMAGLGVDPRVEDFVRRLGLDDKCAAMLRELPAHGQSAIMEVELVNVRNPSAVVQSRIQLFQRTGSISPNSPPVVSPVVPPLGPPSHRAQPMFPPLGPPSGPPLGGPIGGPLGRPPLGPPPGPPLSGPAFGFPPPPQSENVEEYVARFQLDSRVAQDLRALTPFQQRQVIEMELTNARNPSAVVSSRIRSVKGQNQVMMKVEDYIARHQIDESASAMLRELPEELASQVIMTDLSNCRNTSAVLMKRMRQMTGR